MNIWGVLDKNTIGYKVVLMSHLFVNFRAASRFTSAKRSLHRVAERGTLIRVRQTICDAHTRE